MLPKFTIPHPPSPLFAPQFRSKRGVSLMLATMFVAAFLLVMAGLFDARFRALLSVAEKGNESQAAYLSESAAEIATLYAGLGGVGVDSAQLHADVRARLMSPLVAAAAAMGVDACANGDCVNFEVKGRTAEPIRFGQRDVFSVPEKGTGSAAESCVNRDDVEDACNWNRIYVGDSVEVPLYYTDAGGREVRLDLAGANSYFGLRVRAPCDEYAEQCVRDHRIVLYPPAVPPSPDYLSLTKDPVLIQWTIASTDGSEVLLARDLKVGDRRSGSLQENTEIFSGKINSTNTNDLYNKAIEVGFNGKALVNGQLLPPQLISGFINRSNLSKVLRLQLAGQPRRVPQDNDAFDVNDDALFVPYLEYQVLVSGSLSEEKVAIEGTASIGNTIRSFTMDRKRKATLGGFVLENF